MGQQRETLVVALSILGGAVRVAPTLVAWEKMGKHGNEWDAGLTPQTLVRPISHSFPCSPMLSHFPPFSQSPAHGTITYQQSQWVYIFVSFWCVFFTRTICFVFLIIFYPNYLRFINIHWHGVGLNRRHESRNCPSAVVVEGVNRQNTVHSNDTYPRFSSPPANRVSWYFDADGETLIVASHKRDK